ncbi:MAG: hypothetical protein QOK44_3966, partial [Betaproteobacteria bacterium]|nr:hypothetical protein [Betaproteobacteria bacterium]
MAVSRWRGFRQQFIAKRSGPNGSSLSTRYTRSPLACARGSSA